MIISALLLWLTGFVYTVLEHHIPFKKFNEGIILFMAGTMLLVRIGSTMITENWLYYVSLAWFYVLYLLNSLEFWGIASKLFNIRQSKRLFGVVSSGDIPAKFIGYTLALVFVPYTGTLNLLFLGVISMLISVPFYRSIARSEPVHFEDSHEPHAVHHSEHPIRNLYKTFTSSTIIRRIAIISLLASACIILVNYGFYAKIKESYQNDIELAKFIAFFMAGLRIAAMITKTIFTSRLTTNLGVQRSLFITPLVLLGLVGIIIGLGLVQKDERSLFYIFGASSIAVDVMRTSINSPVLLTVMQPLPVHDRLRAHTLIKGIMDPFATLFSGILLIALFNFYGEINLLTICYTLIILAIAWIIGIIYVNREYLNMLVATISSRYFSQEDFTLNDPVTLAKIRDKIASGTEAEVISVLSMVASKQNPISIELLTQFLGHPSEAVRTETTRLVSRKHISELQGALEKMLEKEESPEVKLEALTAVCKLSDSLSAIETYSNSSDPLLRNAALSGMLANRNRSIRFSAEEELAHLLRSENSRDKASALAILEQVSEEYDHPLLSLVLAREKDPTLLRSALAVIGQGASPETLRACMQLYNDFEKQVLAALLRAGEASVPVIEEHLHRGKLTETQQSQLILLLGKISGDEARSVLGRLLESNHFHLPATIKALYRSKFRAGSENRHLLEDIARAYIRYAVELLFMQQRLQESNEPSGLLRNAIELELVEIRELLLCLFGCVYDRDSIKKSRNALAANKKETISNAMEIIEVTVRKDLSKYFTALYEDSGIEERCNALRSIYQENEFREIGTIMERILSEQPIRYQDWTKACSLYISRKYQISIDKEYGLRFLEAPNPLLRETAQFAIA
ncbi:MAG TPA: Npt1/Npt2 family nucleotide transporter [Flavihumibacter sp.]